ncbi:hypothetical protein SteCoe_29729 [Stentor coeruleus]|uniref:Uncharacterized protein n=1 Tax=Stentor coeruleus TaxID=5963 RepID=A0A1R2B577_9CILI|nr:hypothetical protein SteCoe_29729 [Stentor coeruleus]
MLNTSYNSQQKRNLFLPNITNKSGQESKLGVFEQTFISKNKPYGYKIPPLFLDTSFELYRNTPSPRRLGYCKAVESIFDSVKIKTFRNKYSNNRNVSQKITSFKIAQKKLIKKPVKFMITMTKINNSDYKQGSRDETIKEKLEFGCQIDIEKGK